MNFQPAAPDLITDEPGPETPPARRHGSARPRRRYTAVSADERARLREQATRLYGHGLSIRGIAHQLGRSYGFARQLLVEAEVTFRPPGPRQTTKPT